MISVFRGCKLRFERFWISKQLEFLWVYCIHKCAKSTQIFRHQLSHIRPVIHAFYFQFWFFIHEVSCVRITLPLPENPVKLIAWLDFFCIKPSAWARLWCVADFGGSEGGLSPLFYSLFSICLCNQRVQRKEKSSNDCFCCFSQHNKLGLNRVRDDRVTQQFVSAHPLQHAEKYSAFLRFFAQALSAACDDFLVQLYNLLGHNLLSFLNGVS